MRIKKVQNPKQLISDIYKMIVVGKPTSEIIEWIVDNHPINERQAYKYMKKADQFLQKHAEEEMKNFSKKAFRRYDMIFFQAMEKGNLGVAVKTTDSAVKLTGCEVVNNDSSNHTPFIQIVNPSVMVSTVASGSSVVPVIEPPTTDSTGLHSSGSIAVS